jgi:protease I
MSDELGGKRIAIVATDGFEESELFEPMRALKSAGAEVDVIAPKEGRIQGFKHRAKGKTVPVDLSIDAARPEDYEGLVLPGGVANPDELRMDERVVSFVRGFFAAQKPVAAICHGPWTLVEADVVRDRTMTSWPSLKTDLRNAGAKWVDEEVVVDHGLVTSRKPDDLLAFCQKMVEEFAEGAHQEAHGGEAHRGA